MVTMKKSAILVLISILLSSQLLISCWTPVFTPDPVLLTGLGDFQNSKIVTITGKVEILSDGSATLIEKWESKSRISYTIVGDMSEQIFLRDGDVITVDCIFGAMDSPWHGKITIISIHP